MKKQTHDAPRSLVEWRRKKHLTQTEAAAELGISQHYLSKIENRRQIPRRAILENIVKRTGLTADAIIGIAS